MRPSRLPTFHVAVTVLLATASLVPVIGCRGRAVPPPAAPTPAMAARERLPDTGERPAHAPDVVWANTGSLRWGGAFTTPSLQAQWTLADPVADMETVGAARPSTVPEATWERVATAALIVNARTYRPSGATHHAEHEGVQWFEFRLTDAAPVIHRALWLRTFDSYGRAYVVAGNDAVWVHVEEDVGGGHTRTGGGVTVMRSIRPGDTISKNDRVYEPTGEVRSFADPPRRDDWHEFRLRE